MGEPTRWMRAWGRLARCAIGVLGSLTLAVPSPAQAPPGESPYFPGDAPWTQDISHWPVDPESAGVIADLHDHGIWMNPVNNPPARFQIDLGLEVVEVNDSNDDDPSLFRAFTKNGEWYNGDCDFAPVPLPAGGVVEASSSYTCDGYDSFDDCHLIVVHRPSHKLYEMYRANVTGPNVADFEGGCLAVWDLALTYPPDGRGQDCSSADGAGFPIAPLLFNADEVKAGHIDHAVRFTLPNARIRADVYVHPATHSTDPTAGPATAIPYGGRLRLRADYPLSTLPSEGARVIARALQKYGMFLSDGGNVALTAQSDQLTAAKWDDPDVLDGDTHALAQLRPDDFEMVAVGTRYTYTGNCVRSTPLFNDGFEVASPFTTKWTGKAPSP